MNNEANATTPRLSPRGYLIYDVSERAKIQKKEQEKIISKKLKKIEKRY